MNRSPLKIGVTGGIGAGKTVVCRVFSHLNIPVYSADDRAKWLMANDPELVGQIKKQFGAGAYDKNGLNRAYLARRVFSDETKLQLLNSLVHPAVGKDFQQWAESAADAPYCIKEAALLFESGSYRELDKTILVYAPEDIRIKRVLNRDPQRTESDVKAIMGNQMDEEEKRKYADFILLNDDKEMILPQVLKLHQTLTGTD